MNIGRAIRVIRKEKGLTQMKLAELVGISASSLVEIERKDVQPRKETLKEISKALNYPIEYIFLISIDPEDIQDVTKRKIFFSIRETLLEIFKGS